MKTMAKVAGVVLGAVAALCAGVLFYVFGLWEAQTHNGVSLKGLITVLSGVLFVVGAVDAFRRCFPRGRGRQF